jgi:DNA-binding NarL/FixJ family response regulator
MHLALRALLSAHVRFSVLAAARTVLAAKQLVARTRPALLICDADISGESGLDLCRWTRRTSGETRVVVLASRDEPQLARSAIIAGAVGYLLKDSAPEALITSLDQVLGDVIVIDRRLGTSPVPLVRATSFEGTYFSRREREVLTELTGGLDNRAIANQLCISEDTVKTHMKAIFRKLGARDRAHAVALAVGTARPTR